jgi:hypothetical protein
MLLTNDCPPACDELRQADGVPTLLVLISRSLEGDGGGAAAAVRLRGLSVRDAAGVRRYRPGRPAGRLELPQVGLSVLCAVLCSEWAVGVLRLLRSCGRPVAGPTRTLC